MINLSWTPRVPATHPLGGTQGLAPSRNWDSASKWCRWLLREDALISAVSLERVCREPSALAPQPAASRHGALGGKQGESRHVILQGWRRRHTPPAPGSPSHTTGSLPRASYPGGFPQSILPSRGTKLASGWVFFRLRALCPQGLGLNPCGAFH